MRDNAERTRVIGPDRILDNTPAGSVRSVIESLHHHRRIDLIDYSGRNTLHIPAAVKRIKAYADPCFPAAQIQVIADSGPVIAGSVIAFVGVFIHSLVPVHETDLVRDILSASLAAFGPVGLTRGSQQHIGRKAVILYLDLISVDSAGNALHPRYAAFFRVEDGHLRIFFHRVLEHDIHHTRRLYLFAAPIRKTDIDDCCGQPAVRHLFRFFLVGLCGRTG